MIYFTSDTHFGHENAIRFTGRPYSSVNQMNSALIANINARVGMKDELYILGDFSFKMPAAEAYALRKQIVCRKVHLVPGNHDRDWSQPAVSDAFVVEQPIATLKVDGLKIVMSHFPIADWPGIGHHAWHLHGHIHSKGPDYNLFNAEQGLLRYDVGVDSNDYAPVSLDELKDWFSSVPEPRDRVKWPWWVNQTANARIERELEAIRNAPCPGTYGSGHALLDAAHDQIAVEDDVMSDLVARFRELRARTPRSEFLENLTPEKLKEELER